MHLRYDYFLSEVTAPLVSVLFVPIVILFGYAFWLSRKRRNSFQYPPLLIALIVIALSTFIALTLLDYFGFPQHYINAIRDIEDGELSRRAFHYDQAIVVAALSFKVGASGFLGYRISRSLIGSMIAACVLILIGLVAYYGISLSTYPWARRQSYSAQEVLPYLIDLLSFVTIVLVIWSLDAVAMAVKKIRIQESKLPALFTLSLVLPLAGFYFLEFWHAMLWLVFLILALPVMLALIAAWQGGEPFKLEMVFRMFKYQILAVLAAGRWFRRGKLS
jgi:hypothetical protein